MDTGTGGPHASDDALSLSLHIHIYIPSDSTNNNSNLLMTKVVRPLVLKVS